MPSSSSSSWLLAVLSCCLLLLLRCDNVVFGFVVRIDSRSSSGFLKNAKSRRCSCWSRRRSHSPPLAEEPCRPSSKEEEDTNNERIKIKDDRSSTTTTTTEKTATNTIADSTDTSSSSSTIPANLRRKVHAKRPSLGQDKYMQYTGKSLKRRQRKKQQEVELRMGGTSDPTLLKQGNKNNEFDSIYADKTQQQWNNPSMLRISSGIARGRRLVSPNVYLRPMMGKVREAVFSTLTTFGLYDNVHRRIRHLDIFAGSGSVGLESLSRGVSHCTFIDLSNECCDAVRYNARMCGFDGGSSGALNGGEDNYIDDVIMKPRDRVKVIQGDAIEVLSNPISSGLGTSTSSTSLDAVDMMIRPYDIVTLCPPYEEIVYADLLHAVLTSPLVTSDTVVVVEYPIELGSLPHIIHQQQQQTDSNSHSSSGSSSSSNSMVQHRIMVGVRNRRYGRTVIAMYVVNPTGSLPSAESRPEEFISIHNKRGKAKKKLS